MVQSRRISGPRNVPVDLEDLRRHCKVTDPDENSILEAMLDAACLTVEARIWRAVAESDWVCTLSKFPDGALMVPFGPVLSVTSLTYVDADDQEQPLTEETWRLAGNLIEPLTDWPLTASRSEAVILQWTAAPDGDGCPADLAQAVKMLAGWWYQQREAAGPQGTDTVPWGVDMILRSNRNFA